MSTRRKRQDEFRQWWLQRNNNKLPKSRSALLAEARKIADAEGNLRIAKEYYRRDEDDLLRYEQQEAAWVAARDLTEDSSDKP